MTKEVSAELSLLNFYELGWMAGASLGRKITEPRTFWGMTQHQKKTGKWEKN